MVEEDLGNQTADGSIILK